MSGRHKLILSPEEEFATTGGAHGAHLESEGYGTTRVADISRDGPTARDTTEPPPAAVTG